MADAASYGHRVVGEFLRSSFPFMRIYQEYPYKRILELFYKRNVDENVDPSLLARSSRLMADWIVFDINVIVEVQGPHHFGPVSSYGDSLQDMFVNYHSQVARDNTKRVIAEEAGWNLIEFNYLKKSDCSKDKLKEGIMLKKH